MGATPRNGRLGRRGVTTSSAWPALAGVSGRPARRRPAAQAATPARPATAEYYLDLGGSASVGFQPTAARPRGQPTDTGYANDLLTIERARWHDLQLVQFGCPGETTGPFSLGATAVGPPARPNSPRRWPSSTPTRTPCSSPSTWASTTSSTASPSTRSTRAACRERLDLVRQQLPEILSALRAAGGPSLRIVGVGHYDPFLGDYLHGVADQAFAEASVAAIDRLDDTLRSVYAAAGIPMADVDVRSR